LDPFRVTCVPASKPDCLGAFAMRTTPFAAAFAVALAASTAAIADPPIDDHPRLAYVASDGTRAELPLVQSRVDADIRGPIAQIRLTQRYANPLSAAVDAVYVFPLPDDAAVGGMVLATADRKVRAVIKRRDDARRAYDEAKRQGKMAALLDQERPNIFTQSIANLAPGEAVDVELSFDVLLAPEDGVYSLALPTVVGPRYIPAGVTDAAKISPPAVADSDTTVAVSISLDAGVPIRAVASPTHQLAVDKTGESTRTIALAKGVTAADKDVVITWKVDVTEPTVAALADHAGEYGHVALVVQPPPTPVAQTKHAPPREIVFVIDTSGSMAGAPLEIAQAAMRRALSALRPVDRFRVINFSTSLGGLDDGASLPATDDNVGRAISWVDELRSAGGTEMLSGVRAALGRPAVDMNTYVCFLTDGFIGNETDVFAEVERRIDPRTRLFSFGIGSSVNRFLLDRMAKIGRGAVDYVLPGDDNADAVVDRFLARLDAPVLSELSVDWGGLDVVDQTPDALPDLFAGQPIVLVARYQTGGRYEIEITGTRDGKQLTYNQTVELPAKSGKSALIGRLWARRRIEALDRLADTSEAKDVIAERITEIALAHDLMSAHTSFVAIEERDGREVAGQTLVVPVEVPAGVSESGVGADYGYEPDANMPLSRGDYSGSLSADVEEGGLSIASRGRWHGTLDAGLAFTTGVEDASGGETPRRSALAITGAVERRLAGAFGAGLEASLLGRFDRDDVTTISAVLARWALFDFLHLRAGVGACVRLDGELGWAWNVRAGFQLPLGRALGPELSVRVGQARVDAEDDAVTVGVGVGIRF
jgi:Ca-activated chloride channel homolog